jgi:hypothetical protein
VSLKEFLAQHMLERFKLRTHRRLSEAELSRRHGDAARTGDVPKVIEVLIVEPAHIVIIDARLRPIQLDLFIVLRQ